MSVEDVAVPFLNLAEDLLQPDGIKLGGRIEVDVHCDQAGDVLPGVIKALVVTDPASDTEEVDLSPLDGRLQIPGELILQDVGLTLPVVPKVQMVSLPCTKVL